jgi:hypothetical protein
MFYRALETRVDDWRLNFGAGLPEAVGGRAGC